MSRQIIEIAADPLETLRRCGGYYNCPIDPGTGERMGPLVAYAGTYSAPDGKKKHFVGDVYANFARAEVHTNVLLHFADGLRQKLFRQTEMNRRNLVFCGAPIGGYDLARAMGFVCDAPVIKAEKKVIVAGSEDRKEESQIVFFRHSVERGDEIVWVEDVCNNFSTTDKGIGNICKGGGVVIAILCFLNRSPMIDNIYHYMSETGGISIPVVSLVRMPIAEWVQEDPAVAGDVARGNVVWNPKNKDEWHRLMRAMEDAKRL